MPPNSFNLIQELLARSVAKIQDQQKKNAEETTRTDPDSLLKKLKPKVYDAKSDYRTGGKKPTNNLTKAIVYNHLKEVAPELAKEFRSEHKFRRTRLQLRRMVTDHIKSKQLMKELDFKECGVQKSKQSRNIITKVKGSFTPEEDDIIKAAMKEAGEEEVDYQSLTELLNRIRKSVISRVDWIKRTGGFPPARKHFTLVEDMTLIEKIIIPRLATEKLPQINLLEHECMDLANQLDKTNDGVRYRWSKNLQPWLLQHYSGTLNLRVERMLANHLAETFKDVLQVDWSMVAASKEFAGHTKHSLKHIYSNLKTNVKVKLNLLSSEVTLQQVADHSELVYGEGAQGKAQGRLGSKKMQHQSDVIAFFERKLKELGIGNFL